MAYTITFTNEAYDKGVEFDIPGLGILKNGEPRKLTEDEERAYVGYSYMTVKDGFKDSELIKVEGTTEIKGGVEGVLGVDPTTISDTPSLDPTAENAKVAKDTDAGFKPSVDGSTTPPVEVVSEVPAEPDKTTTTTNK